MSKYYVTYHIDASYTVEVCADDIEEAKVLAEDAWRNANFGDAENIEVTPIMVENENDYFMWL